MSGCQVPLIKSCASQDARHVVIWQRLACYCTRWLWSERACSEHAGMQCMHASILENVSHQSQHQPTPAAVTCSHSCTRHVLPTWRACSLHCTTGTIYNSRKSPYAQQATRGGDPQQGTSLRSHPASLQPGAARCSQVQPGAGDALCGSMSLLIMCAAAGQWTQPAAAFAVASADAHAQRQLWLAQLL
jgi:hypothetical protein